MHGKTCASRVRRLWSNARRAAIDPCGLRGERAGGFWDRAYQGALNAELFVSLLRRMMLRRLKPVHFVLDELPAHKTTLVKTYVASTKRMLTLHFLPIYAPELNPDELVCSHVKRTAVARAPLRRDEKLQAKIEAQLSAVKRIPQLILSFFNPSVTYITTETGWRAPGAWDGSAAAVAALAKP